MKYLFCLALILCGPVITADAQEKTASAKPVAPVADLLLEAQSKLGMLKEFAADEDAFKKAHEEEQPMAAGVLACMAQAIAEHPEKDSVKVSAVALRDAAIAARDAENLGDAKKALAAIEQALVGNAPKDGQDVTYNWAELIGMYEMMEEINTRNSRLNRILRRSRKPQEDSLHATTNAVLARAMEADTWGLEDKAKIHRWVELTREYRKQMVVVAASIKKKDTKTAKTAFAASLKTCTQCHEEIRDQ